MIAILFSFLCSVSSVALMGIAGYLIARAAEMPELAALSLGVVGVRFFGLSRGAFRYVERLCSHSLAFAELKKFRLHLYRMLEPLVPYKLAGISESEMLSKISADAEEYKSWLPKAGVPLFAGMLSLIASISVLSYLNAYYALCYFLSFLLLFSVSSISFFIIKKRVKEYKISSDELSEFSLSVSHGMAEKKSWGIFSQISDRWKILGDAEEEKRKNIYIIYSIAEIFSLITPFLCLAGMLTIGAGEYSFPVWIGILLGTLASFELLQEMPFIALQSALSICSKPSLASHISPSAHTLSAYGCHPSKRGEFFAYIHSPFSILHSQLSDEIINVNPGDVLIISAPSGAGKTLLANSIAGFLQNDNVIERTDSFVFLEQEPFLFTGTIRENLQFANRGATDEEMRNALRKADLKYDLDLWIGERGFGMSGGERQRLSAARAMLVKSDLVIADEPCAHLPVKDEIKLFNEFVNLPHKPAVLWLSHNAQMLRQHHP